MAAGKWKLYNATKEYIGDGTIDLDTNTFNIALFTSASNANTLSNSVLADLTNQVAGGTGYTTGGQALTSVTWSQTGGTATFDAANVEWTAASGSITARFAVIYRTGTVNTVTDALVAVCLLDTTPADVTATDGNKLQINFNASGIFTLSGATTD
jgi:hypothetical protein